MSSVCLGLALAANEGRAQPSEAPRPDPKAEALFKEARSLMGGGNYEEACPKLEEARRIQPGMGTVYNLADCYEHIGRTASAWSGFMDVAAAADAAGQPERAQAARQRALSLAPRLPKLRIVISQEIADLGVEVRRDGIPVGPLLWGTDVPIDPGRHRVIVSAPAKSVWNSAVDVLEPGKVVIVNVPMLRPEGEAPPLSTIGDEPAPPPTPPKHQPGRSVVPVIVLSGAAVAGIGAGIGLLVASGSKRMSADSIRSGIQGGSGALNGCLATPKPADCEALGSEVRGAAALQNVSIGAFALGGLSAASMITYLLWPAPTDGSSRSARAVRVLPVLGPASGGLGISGRF